MIDRNDTMPLGIKKPLGRIDRNHTYNTTLEFELYYKIGHLRVQWEHSCVERPKNYDNSNGRAVNVDLSPTGWSAICYPVRLLVSYNGK